jgi:cob(I)alamin adenosyltransferase
VKIYTRTGDDGTTSLFAGGRVSKGHLRLHAYGTVDELNAVLGLAIATGVSDSLLEALQRIQGELFVLGADLATPLGAEAKWIVRVAPDMVGQLEHEIDEWQRTLPELKNFILPGGSVTGAFLHQARTVCRRAERWVVMLGVEEELNKHVRPYLNRLSDWLFVAARVANFSDGQPEIEWDSRSRCS